jgi:serine/threonine protein kinase
MFSQDFKATDSTTGVRVWVRVWDITELGQPPEYDLTLEILAENAHPATLRLIGFLVAADNVSVASPFAANGLVAGAIRQSAIDTTQKSKMVFGVASGMADLHSRAILHRDLKPDHIFLGDKFEPVIADFVLPARFKRGERFL